MSNPPSGLLNGPIYVRVNAGAFGSNIQAPFNFVACVNTAAPAGLTDGFGTMLSVDANGSVRVTTGTSPIAVVPANQGDTIYNAGKQAAPGAGTVIATITPGAGYWEVDVSINTTGEVVANNVEMRKAGAALYTPLFVPPTGAVSGEASIQEKFFITLAAGNTLDIRAIAAATGGSTYQGSIRARKVG